MRLENTRENYYFYSGKASDILRYLSLAGLALIWVFKAESGARTTLPSGLVLSALLLSLGLLTDYMQYLTGTAVWGVFNRHLEKKSIAPDVEFMAPGWINWPTIALFWVKSVVVVLGYFLLIAFLVQFVNPR